MAEALMRRHLGNERTLGLPILLVLTWLAACPSVPRYMPQTPRNIPRTPKPDYSYQVYLIPLYQELGVPARVDQIEERACYVFTMAAPEVDTLFRAAIEMVPFRTMKPRIVLDPRLKLVQQGTRRALVVTADRHVLAIDRPYVYKLGEAVVRKAVATVLAAARPVKERHSACFSPEPPPGWSESLPKSCP